MVFHLDQAYTYTLVKTLNPVCLNSVKKKLKHYRSRSREHVCLTSRTQSSVFEMLGWRRNRRFNLYFLFLLLLFSASHHSAATNRGYSRKHDGGFYGCWWTQNPYKQHFQPFSTATTHHIAILFRHFFNKKI